MGTNGLAFLLHRLEQGPRHFIRPIPHWVQDTKLFHLAFDTYFSRDSVERKQTVTALVALCPLPPDAVKKLRDMSVDFQRPAWRDAADLLRANENLEIAGEALAPYE
jgi:hypothetical protein